MRIVPWELNLEHLIYKSETDGKVDVDKQMQKQKRKQAVYKCGKPNTKYRRRTVVNLNDII